MSAVGGMSRPKSAAPEGRFLTRCGTEGREDRFLKVTEHGRACWPFDPLRASRTAGKIDCGLRADSNGHLGSQGN